MWKKPAISSDATARSSGPSVSIQRGIHSNMPGLIASVVHFSRSGRKVASALARAAMVSSASIMPTLKSFNSACTSGGTAPNPFSWTRGDYNLHTVISSASQAELNRSLTGLRQQPAVQELKHVTIKEVYFHDSGRSVSR